MRHMIVAVCLGAGILGGSASIIAAEGTAVRRPATYERKDVSGRLLNRIVFNADGTVHHTAIAYGRGGARLQIERELDKAREPLVEKRETFDDDGRIVERQEMRVVDGQRTETRTTYSYDATGRQTSQTEIP